MLLKRTENEKFKSILKEFLKRKLNRSILENLSQRREFNHKLRNIYIFKFKLMPFNKSQNNTFQESNFKI